MITPASAVICTLAYTLLYSVHQEKCHQYWPAERSARYQYFVVDPMAEYNMPQYILREFKVTDARVRWQNLGTYCDLCVIVHVQSERICVHYSNSLNALILITPSCHLIYVSVFCVDYLGYKKSQKKGELSELLIRKGFFIRPHRRN